uniref:MAK10-like protein n=1 Tax=Tanacetum cinerariifolium TaxID=118510 RepID=A0A6L2KMT8_TANCI|nr:MAK10-like protein [Tanacetum cinerariifolium]
MGTMWCLFDLTPSAAGGKLRDKKNKESWALPEDLALYDNKSWNDPRNFAKPVKAISMPQDVSSTSDRPLIELENQVQHLIEAHLAPNQPIQVNKITSSCKMCSGTHDTQFCMENPEQAFVDYASSRTDEARGLTRSIFRVRELDFGDETVPCWTTIGKHESYKQQTSKAGIELERHLDEIHVTWTLFWKKEYDFTPKEGLKNKSQMVETASRIFATPSGSASDRVMKRSELNIHKETLEDSTASRFFAMPSRLFSNIYKLEFRFSNSKLGVEFGIE